MMKLFRRIVATVLALIMLCSLLCMEAFAAEPTGSELRYVVLGSSQTNGYGLHGYVDERFYDWGGTAAENEDWETNGYNAAKWNSHARFDVSVSGYRNLVPESYPALITSALEAEGYDVTCDQLALSSMRVEELRILLDDSFNGDAFTDWRFNDSEYSQRWFARDGGLTALRADYQQSIADADIITYDLGANNFGVYMSLQLLHSSFTEDIGNIIGREYADEFYAKRSSVESALTTLTGGALSDELFGTLNHVADTLTYALVGFCVNFDKTMERIYALNPDAQVTVVSIQNPLAGFTINTGDSVFPLGDIIDIPIKLANLYISTLSTYRSKYSYADIRSCGSVEGRVETFLDDLHAYSTSTDLTTNLKDCLTTLDGQTDGLFLRERVTAALSDAGYAIDGDAYEADLIAAYDAAMLFLQECEKSRQITLEEAFSGDISAVETILYQLVGDVALAQQEGRDPHAVLRDTITYLETNVSAGDIAAFRLEIWTIFGNSFFAHPNPNGCRQAAEKILSVMNRSSIASAVEKAQANLAALFREYGSNACTALMAHFNVGNRTINTVSSQLAKLTDPEQAARLIMQYLQISDPDIAQKVDAYIADYIASEGPHTHAAQHRSATSATCTKSGSRECWYCPGCGKYFTDSQCSSEVTKDSLIVPAEHDLCCVSKRSATLFCSGNSDYYICRSCNQCFSDANGVHAILRSSVKTPSRLWSFLTGFSG